MSETQRYWLPLGVTRTPSYPDLAEAAEPWVRLCVPWDQGGVGRHLWKSSCPAPAKAQHHLQQVVQDCAQVCFSHIWGRRLPSSSGQPVPALHRPEGHVLALLCTVPEH